MRQTDKITAIVPCLWANDELFDMTLTCLEGLFPKVDQLIVINDEQSYAKTVNKGLSIADGEIIIICNNDIEFIQDDWLKHLINPLESYDISSIRTTDADGWKTEDRLEEGAKFGSLWALKREVYDTIGGLDETFGNYFEDLDFHKRAEDAGFKVVKNHAGLVEHKGKATFMEIDPEDKNFIEARKKFRAKWGKIW